MSGCILIVPRFPPAKLLYLDASSGRMNKLLNDWLGGISGAYILMLLYIFFVLVNLQVWGGEGARIGGRGT